MSTIRGNPPPRDAAPRQPAERKSGADALETVRSTDVESEQTAADADGDPTLPEAELGRAVDPDRRKDARRQFAQGNAGAEGDKPKPSPAASPVPDATALAALLAKGQLSPKQFLEAVRAWLDEAFGRAKKTGAPAAPTTSSTQITNALREGFAKRAAEVAKDDRPGPGGTSKAGELRAIFEQAFAGKARGAAGDRLMEEARNGTLPQPARVRFVDKSVLNGDRTGDAATRRGAYDPRDGGTIYLDKDLLKGPPAALHAVYAEEVGHHLDVVLGGPDSKGDEGEIFARGLGRGARLNDAELAEARADDDHGVIVVDGKEVAVEFNGGPAGVGGPAAGPQGAVPGDALPAFGMPPLDPAFRDEVVKDAATRQPNFQGPQQVKFGGMDGPWTPFPAQAAAAFEFLARERQNAMMALQTAGTPQAKAEAYRRLVDVQKGMENLQGRLHMAPKMAPTLQVGRGINAATLDQNARAHAQALQQGNIPLDAARDDFDALWNLARNGDPAAKAVWQRAKAAGDPDVLAAIQKAESLAGENVDQAKSTIDELLFAENPADRKRLLDKLDKEGGIGMKKEVDELKVRELLTRFKESGGGKAARAQLKKDLAALGQDNYWAQRALGRIAAEERAEAAPPIAPGVPTVGVESVGDMTKEMDDRRGSQRATVITRGLTSDSSPDDLAKARQRLEKEPDSPAKKDTLAKVTTQEQLGRLKRPDEAAKAIDALRAQAKENNPYARAALRTSLMMGTQPGVGGNGDGAGDGPNAGRGPGRRPGPGPGRGPDDAPTTVGDMPATGKAPVSMGVDDMRVRLPEMSPAELKKMQLAAVETFSDGKMSRDEAFALADLGARTNDRQILASVKAAFDKAIELKNDDALRSLGDILALGVGQNARELVPTLMKAQSMPDFPREVGKLAKACSSGCKPALDVMALLTAQKDARYGDVAEAALVRGAKAGFAEDVTRALTDAPTQKKDQNTPHFYRALGKAAAEWKDPAKVDKNHKDEVMRELELTIKHTDPTIENSKGRHVGAADGLAAVPHLWRAETIDAVTHKITPQTLKLIEDVSPKLTPEQAKQLKEALVKKLESGRTDDPKERETTALTARALGNLGKWCTADDVKLIAKKFGKLPKNTDGFSALVNMMSRLEDPAAKAAAKEVLFDKENRWEKLNSLGYQDRDKLVAYVLGSGDDDLSTDIQKLIYDLNIRPPVAGLFKQLGVGGTPQERRDKALAARANYGDENARKLGARVELWNKLTPDERVELLGLDPKKLTDRDKAFVSQTLDAASSAEKMAAGTLHRSPQAFLLQDLEKKLATIARTHAGTVGGLQKELREMAGARTRDVDATARYAEKGVDFFDDVGHVMSYLNPGNLIYGRPPSNVDQFDDNQKKQIQNIERHDRAMEAKAKEIGGAMQKQLMSETSLASYGRASAMAEGHQRRADLIALDQWRIHGDALRSLNPEMYAELHKKGDGDPRNEGAWQRLERNGDVVAKAAPEYTGTPDQRRAKALAALSKPIVGGPEAAGIRNHALHTIDTDPSLQRMQETAGILARGLPDLQKLATAGMKGRKYDAYVEHVRDRARAMTNALDNMKQDLPGMKLRLAELEKAKAGADPTTKSAIEERIKSIQGMIDMVEKSDGLRNLLDTVLDKSKFNADTWANWAVNEGPKILAAIAVGVACAALCVATCGAAAPAIVVMLAAAAGGAAGGLLGYEAASEGMHYLRNKYDPDVTSGKLKYGDRSKLGAYAAGEQIFDAETGKYRPRELWGDVVKPYAIQFATDFAITFATMGVARVASGAISKVGSKLVKVFQRNPALGNRLGSSMAQLEAKVGKEGAKRTLDTILKQAGKEFPKEFAEEIGDEIKESVLEKLLEKIDKRLGMAASVILGTGKGINIKTGGAPGFTYDGSTFADTIKALESDGHKVTLDPKTPGHFVVGTADGPIHFAPTDPKSVSKGDYDAAKISLDAMRADAKMPDTVGKDPAVLVDRAKAVDEMAAKLKADGGDPTRIAELEAEAKRLRQRAEDVRTGKEVDADRPIARDDKTVSPKDRGLFTRLFGWKRQSSDATRERTADAQRSKMHALPGWASLDPQTQGIADAALSMEGDPVFDGLQKNLTKLLADPTFLRADAKTQAMAIEKALSDTKNVGTIAPTMLRAPAKYTVGPGVVDTSRNDQFRVQPNETPPNARVHVVEIDDGKGGKHSVTIVSPDGAKAPPGTKIATPEQTAQMLARLPVDVLAKIKTVVINPNQSPSDSYWRQQPGYSPDHTSTMQADSREGTIHMFPDTAISIDKYAVDMAHEVGHFVSDNGYAKDLNNPAWDPWKAAIAKDKTKASQYAESNVAEDFAETYALYQMTKGTPAHDAYRKMMPERFRILDGMSGKPVVVNRDQTGPDRPTGRAENRVDTRVADWKAQTKDTTVMGDPDLKSLLEGEIEERIDAADASVSELAAIKGFLETDGKTLDPKLKTKLDAAIGKVKADLATALGKATTFDGLVRDVEAAKALGITLDPKATAAAKAKMTALVDDVRTKGPTALDGIGDLAKARTLAISLGLQSDFDTQVRGALLKALVDPKTPLHVVKAALENPQIFHGHTGDLMRAVATRLSALDLSTDPSTSPPKLKNAQTAAEVEMVRGLLAGDSKLATAFGKTLQADIEKNLSQAKVGAGLTGVLDAGLAREVALHLRSNPTLSPALEAKVREAMAKSTATADTDLQGARAMLAALNGNAPIAGLKGATTAVDTSMTTRRDFLTAHAERSNPPPQSSRTVAPKSLLLPGMPGAVYVGDFNTGGTTRPTWLSPDGKMYQWDFEGGRVERYSSSDGKWVHEGEFDALDGHRVKNGKGDDRVVSHDVVSPTASPRTRPSIDP